MSATHQRQGRAGRIRMHTAAHSQLESTGSPTWGRCHNKINVSASKRQQALLQGRSGGGRGVGDAEAARLQGRWQGRLDLRTVG